MWAQDLLKLTDLRPWRKSSTSPAPIAVTLWDSQANNYAGNTLFLPLGCSWLPPNWNLLVRPGPPWWFSSESACQCRGHGFELWAGKATKHCATTTEPVSRAWELQPLHPHILNPYKACILDPGLCTQRCHHSERPVHLNEDPVYLKINKNLKKSNCKAGVWGARA